MEYSWYWMLHPDSFLKDKASFSQLLGIPSLDSSHLDPSQRNALGHKELPHLKLRSLSGESPQSMSLAVEQRTPCFNTEHLWKDIQLQSSLESLLMLSCIEGQCLPLDDPPFLTSLQMHSEDHLSENLFISESISMQPNLRLKSIIMKNKYTSIQ